jgi:cbb3-type cytochrome oxidase maturation protein
MDILYLLIPLSDVLVFFILGGLWWAIDRGQFDDIESEGERVLRDS